MDNIIVLGSTGCIGRSLIKILQEKKTKYKYFLRDEYDALDQTDFPLEKDFGSTDIVINLLGEKTSIKLNQEKPAEICYNTLQMNMNVLEICRKRKVKKLINIISSCAYGQADSLKEKNFLKGNIHDSVAPHGEAKKIIYLLGKYYRQQYGLNVVAIAINAIYGNTTWDKPNTLKALEGLVKKIVDARESNLFSVNVWGSGSPKREWLYVDDAAQGILKVSQSYDKEEILNIGCGYDISIKDLSNGIKLAANYKGNIVLDHSYPDGQNRKVFDIQNMKKVLNGWEPTVSLSDGIAKTIIDYERFLNERNI